MRTLIILLFSTALSAQNAITTAKLTVGTRAYAIITVCANALCTGGLLVNQFVANVNSSSASSWRLVYRAGVALSLEQTSGFTYTVNGLYVDATQAACVAWAAANGITISPAVHKNHRE